MDKNEEIEIVRKAVTDYVDKNLQTIAYQTSENKEHFINCGTDIMCEKWKVGSAGTNGAFVTAFGENKLIETFSTADYINKRFILEYCLLWYNLQLPKELRK